MADQKSKQIPSLDGLRAISILLVIVAHVSISSYDEQSSIRHLLDHGRLGVRIFFVISGFLITSILLDEKRKFGRISLAAFYGRRALRILPAFYVYVAAVVILKALHLIELPPYNLAWVLTYMVNFSTHNVWFTGHLWSLSVEEQFYLLWPLAVKVLRERTRNAVAVLCAFSGAVTAGILRFLFHKAEIPIYAFPYVCGTLAIGCLAAIYQDRIRHIIHHSRILRSSLVMLLFPVILFLDLLNPGSLYRPLAILADCMIALIVCQAVFCPETSAGKVLNSRPLVFLGKLSYSVYLWQQLALQNVTAWPITRFPLNLLFIFGAALASYFLLEKPFMKLRSRLRPHSDPKPVPVRLPVAFAPEPSYSSVSD